MTESTPNPDGISSAQGARLEERISNIGVLLKEVRDDQKKTNESLGSVIGVQRDVNHLAVKQAETEAAIVVIEKALEVTGKHVAIVSMWGKVAFTLMTVAVTSLGWGVWMASKIDSRVTSLETIVNAKALESTFDPPVVPDQSQAPASPGRRR